MTEAKSNPVSDAIREARQHLAQELCSQAEQLDKLEGEFRQVRERYQRLEDQAQQQWEAIERAQASIPQVSPDETLEDVLAAVRNLITCTLPEQVLEVLAGEAAQLGARAAVFDVRGKAAWGAAANGFGPQLTEKTIRSVIIPLTQENPFRHVCETGGPIEASAETLKKNRNVLEKLKPAAGAPILLLPIRSAGTVSAILYADPSGEGAALPVNALKILSEFAGAQLDRMIVLSGGLPAGDAAVEAEKPAEPEAPMEEAPVEEAPVEPAAAQAVEEAPEAVKVVETPASEPPAPPVEVELAVPYAPADVAAEAPAAPAESAVEASAPPPAEPESAPAPAAVETPAEMSVPPPPGAAPAVEDVAATAPPPAPKALAESGIAQLSEAEQKVHQDAKRFAKLLVSEIELYNKVKVADGRKNKDLYKRLKSDIERSRQTYKKRFGKSVGQEFDFFHEELVSILGANDSTVLGPDYPGPTA